MACHLAMLWQKMYRLVFFLEHGKFHWFIGHSCFTGSVATYVRCGGISTQRYVANFQLSLIVKEFLKSVKIWQSYCEMFGGFLFWNTVFIGNKLWLKSHDVTHSCRSRRIYHTTCCHPHLTMSAQPRTDWATFCFEEMIYGQVRFDSKMFFTKCQLQVGLHHGIGSHTVRKEQCSSLTCNITAATYSSELANCLFTFLPGSSRWR